MIQLKIRKKYKNEEKRSLAISDLYFHVSSLLPINCSKWVTSTTYDKDKEELWVYTKYVVPTGKDLNFVNKKETHEFNKNGKKLKKKKSNMELDLMYYFLKKLMKIELLKLEFL